MALYTHSQPERKGCLAARQKLTAFLQVVLPDTKFVPRIEKETKNECPTPDPSPFCAYQNGEGSKSALSSGGYGMCPRKGSWPQEEGGGDVEGWEAGDGAIQHGEGSPGWITALMF